MQKQHELGSNFKNNAFVSRLCYLVDIFDQLNRLNLKLQGKRTTIIDFMDAFNAFVQIFENWTRKAEKGNFAMFEAFSIVSSDDVDDALSSEILVHLTSLRKEFLRYFPDISESDLKLVMTYRMSSLTLKMILLAEICLKLLSICEFWQKCALLTRVSLKSASQSCYLSVIHIYANQGFPL